MNRSTDKRTPFSPEPGKIYENEGGGRFLCQKLQYGSQFNAWLVNVLSGWSFLAHGVGIYPDGRIDWDYPTHGRFTKFQLQEPKAEPAPSSRKRAPMTAGEKRKLQNAQKEKARITKDSDRDFKRATLWKLMKARNGGLTIGTIVANSEGKLTENTVLDILNAVPRSEADYRALDAALDRCAAE